MRRRCPTRPTRPSFEELEPRALPAVLPWPGLDNPVVESETNDTLDTALDLGTATGGRLEAVGTIGDSDAGAADVDWYQFTLDNAATVRVTTLNRAAGSQQLAVVGLYASNPADPSNFAYRFRLLAQDDAAASGGDAALEYVLGSGTYWVAVSGSGNAHFHPHLAGSGLDGSTGDYGLLVTATDLPAVPPVLSTDPADGAVLDRSPLVVRARLAARPGPGETLSLRDADDNEMPATYNFNAATNEARLLLRRALPEGTYRVSLRDADGVEIAGTSFTVAGVEGVAGNDAGNDAALTAIDLGDVSDGGLVQRAGAIGDDPFYDPANSAAHANRPAADVDLYHFRVSGPGRFALLAEAFAGRVGSGLNAGLSLFRRDEGTGELVLVAGNNNTFNGTRTTLNALALQFDPALFVGLTAGDYYLAVSATGNVPDPELGLLPGESGLFNPNVAHSGEVGTTTGRYVLNLRVLADNDPPRVTATSVSDGATLAAPPTVLTVQFSEVVNLQQLGYGAYQQSPGTYTLPAVFVRGSDGFNYAPRYLSYDPATNQATFLMLAPLPNGPAELHLSPSLGLADLAGNALVGNDASGDYVVRFDIAGSPRGSPGDPLVWLAGVDNDSLAAPQEIGVLFPDELQAGVTFRRDFTSDPSAPADTEDYYRFEVLQERTYLLTLPASANLPPGAAPRLFAADGTEIVVPLGAPVTLAVGTYLVQLGWWDSGDAPTVTYDLQISLGGSPEGPTPLTTGPSPALRVRLATTATPAAPPGATGGSSGAATATAGRGNAPSLLASLGSGPVGGTAGSTVAGGAGERLALGGTGPGGGMRALALTLTIAGSEEEKKERKAEKDDPAAGSVLRLWSDLVEALPWIGMAWGQADQPSHADLTAPSEAVVDEVFLFDEQARAAARPDEGPAGEEAPAAGEPAGWLAAGALGLLAPARRRRVGRASRLGRNTHEAV